MKSIFDAAVREASRLTRQQSLTEATRVIQNALSRPGSAPPFESSPDSGRLALPPPTDSSGAAAASAHPPRRAEPTEGMDERPAPTRNSFGRVRMPLGDVMRLLRKADPSSAVVSRKRQGMSSVAVPDGASWLSRTFMCEAGSREYQIYIPSRASGRLRPLIVMLHGCTQNPDDFALGTGMNQLAEEQGFVVAYPRQPSSANPSGCWNWFDAKDQRRDAGEPAIIAGITRALIAEFDIDPARVFIAGLSAGGAMAAIMGAAYPDLYAAIGVHSGLPHGSAVDMVSAFAAMRGNSGLSQSAPTRAARKPQPGDGDGCVRTIIFHGSADKTVHPSNGDSIFSAASANHRSETTAPEQGSAGGRAYRRATMIDDSGVIHAEHWVVDGLGHAWCGGRSEGSYADPLGPDASREMVRFFLSGITPGRAPISEPPSRR